VDGMLVSLSMNNFGLFKKANIDFSESFNVITGESGTGKSMFLDSINVFLTGNVPQNLKTTEGSVSAFFIVNNQIKEIVQEYAPVQENELILSVNFTPKKTLFRINDTIVPRDIVQEISKFLIELHSQESNIALRDETYQNSLIFKVLRENFPDYFEFYDLKYQEYLRLKKRYDNLPSNINEVLRNIDLLDYQIKVIEEVDPKPFEDDELSERFKTLNNKEEIKEKIYESLNILKDNEVHNMDIDIGTVVFNLSKIADFGFKDEYNMALSMQEQIDFLYNILQSKVDDLDLDPQELQTISDRLNKIMDLKRKYGPTLEDVLENLEKYKKEKEDLEEIKKDFNELEPKLNKLSKELIEESENIIDKTKPFLNNLKDSIEEHLKDLNMGNAEIDFSIEKLKEPKKEGAHRICFLLKTNPKSDFLPLSEIASGGELSRIILALEVVLGNTHTIDTMIFDEIDSGVGPRMADVVGKKLKELSKNKQIIVITHMPQVANLADTHFKIIKSLNEDDINSEIIHLNQDEKQKEIKEMYGSIIY
jgi:DNA repair protein RecN (Recombination protein N)